MSEVPVFFLHGLAYAGLLFLVSAGLTLVFGMMNVLNFAHAAMYMLGAYFSFTLLRATGQFWLCLFVCPLLLFIIGALVERFLLRRVHAYGHLHELLLTFGLAYIITELVKMDLGQLPAGREYRRVSRPDRRVLRDHLPHLPDLYIRMRRLRRD